MPSRDRRTRLRITVSVVVLASITLITLDARDVAVVESMKSSMGDALTGGDGALGTITRPFRNMWHGVAEYDELKEENGRLREELSAQENQGRDEALASNKLAELAELVGVGFTSDYDTVVARRTSGPNSNWDSNTAYIDVGRADGVADDMPVVNADGLVGHVETAYERRSQIRLITEVDLRFSVRIGDEGLPGVGHGVGSFDRPWVIDAAVDLGAPVTLGQQVVTSGVADSRFPPGLPVGTVSRIQPDDAQKLTRLDVDMAVDFTTFDFVEVVLWTPDGPKPEPAGPSTSAADDTTDGGAATDTSGEVTTTTGRDTADPFDPGDSEVGINPGAAPSTSTATTALGSTAGG
ncbi:MAG: rod shape-determining protein MreC [Microthrixaceae bacterium]|nr:rod shape-determining protein MreC [Microthrixaceae bacterium]